MSAVCLTGKKTSFSGDSRRETASAVSPAPVHDVRTEESIITVMQLTVILTPVIKPMYVNIPSPEKSVFSTSRKRKNNFTDDSCLSVFSFVYGVMIALISVNARIMNFITHPDNIMAEVRIMRHRTFVRAESFVMRVPPPFPRGLKSRASWHR